MTRAEPRPVRSRLWPPLITALGIVLLLGLGTWQLDRMSWKAGLIATLDARQAAPPIDLATTTEVAEALDFRRVRVSGRFLNDRELHRVSRVHNGRAGYGVITPLRLADGTSVLVDRGWVPLELKAAASRPDSLPPGQVTVEGMIRLPRPPGWFTPENDPATDQWFSMDIAAMAAAAGLKRVRPYFIVAAVAGDGDTLPIPRREIRPELPNNHLQYAITWYALAVALGVIYIVWRRRERA